MLCPVMFGCTQGSERVNKVLSTQREGTAVIYQEVPNCSGCDDTIIVRRTNGEYILFEITGTGRITKTDKLNIKKCDEVIPNG